MKTCEVCGKEFRPYTSRHRFCTPTCKDQYWTVYRDQEKKARYLKNWGDANKDKRRDYNLRRTFGITLEKYYELLTEQNNACAVCGKTPEQEGRFLAVDHDHKTNEIFGLLCGNCNRRLIGRHRDPELFRKAAAFLEKGTGLFVPEKKKKNKSNRNRMSRKRSVRGSERGE